MPRGGRLGPSGKQRFFSKKAAKNFAKTCQSRRPGESGLRCLLWLAG
jgi:hypothetical protein